MRIYLAGPMRGSGREDWNFPAFDGARERLVALGHHVFCPAALFRAMNYPLETGEERSHCTHAIQMDLACIYAADAIALLPGWESSRGVTVELAMAQFLSMPVYCAMTMERIYPRLTPWRSEVMDAFTPQEARARVEQEVSRQKEATARLAKKLEELRER